MTPQTLRTLQRSPSAREPNLGCAVKRPGSPKDGGCHSSARRLLLQCGDNNNEENREHLDQLKTESDQSALSDGDDAVCRGVGVRPRHPARQGVGRGAGAAAERTRGQEAGAAAAGPAAKKAREGGGGSKETPR